MPVTPSLASGLSCCLCKKKKKLGRGTSVVISAHFSTPKLGRISWHLFIWFLGFKVVAEEEKISFRMSVFDVRFFWSSPPQRASLYLLYVNVIAQWMGDMQSKSVSNEATWQVLVLLVSLPNWWLSLLTPRMRMGDDVLFLATYANGTSISKLVGSFPRTGSLSNRLPLVVCQSSCSLGNPFLDMTWQLGLAWLSSGAIPM